MVATLLDTPVQSIKVEYKNSAMNSSLSSEVFVVGDV